MSTTSQARGLDAGLGATADLAERVPDAQQTSTFLEQNKTIIFVGLLWSAGWVRSWTAQLTPQLWYQGVLVLGLVAVRFVSSNRTFSGPARMAHLESASLATSFIQHLSSWFSPGIIISVLFPVATIWALALVLIGWQFLLYKYHEGVQKIADNADKSSYPAVVAADRATKHVEEARRYG